jgi:thiol-disulfide isomerase/thioredoxin
MCWLPWIAYAGADPALPGLERLDQAPPALHLVATDGSALTSDDWRGRMVVLHFFATWCGPCRKELPALDALAHDLDPARALVVLVAIDDDRSADELAAFARDLGVTLPVYVGRASEVPSAFWTWGVPVTYLLNARDAPFARCLGPRPWSILGDTLRAMLP